MKFCVVLFALLSIALQVSASDNLVPEGCRDLYPTPTYTPGVELTKNQKCLLRCALQYQGVMNSIGLFNPVKAINLAAKYGTIEQAKTAVEKAVYCALTTENFIDLCDKAEQNLLCFGVDVIERFLTDA